MTPAPEPAPEPQQSPADPPSIVGEERPDPGADPTTRLGSVWPPDSRRKAAGPGDPDEPEDEATVDVVGGDRSRSVNDHERPADEAADDPTRRLVPGQRRPRRGDYEAPDRRS